MHHISFFFYFIISFHCLNIIIVEMIIPLHLSRSVKTSLMTSFWRVLCVMSKTMFKRRNFVYLINNEISLSLKYPMPSPPFLSKIRNMLFIRTQQIIYNSTMFINERAKEHIKQGISFKNWILIYWK